MTLPKDLRDAYVCMIQDIRPNVAITLNTFPGYQATDLSMQSKLGHFDAQVARKALGRRWATRPASKRINGVFVLEHGSSGTHPHWHGFVRVPEEHLIRYAYLMKSVWESASKRAWIEIESEALENYTTRAAYVLKEVCADSTDRIVFTNMLRG